MQHDPIPAYREAPSDEDVARDRGLAALIEEAQEAGEDPFAEVELHEFVPDDDVGPVARGTDDVTAMRRWASIAVKRFGLRVLTLDGWEERGHRDVDLLVEWLMAHHTAATSDVDELLKKGRPGISGPLSNTAGHKNGDRVLVAAYRANHAGVSAVPSSRSIGHEETGPFPAGNKGKDAFRYAEYVDWFAAGCLAYGLPPSRIIAHKEAADPDGRKPDPAFEEDRAGDGFPEPYPEMDRFRADVARRIKETEEDDVNAEQLKDALLDALESDRGKAALDGAVRRQLRLATSPTDNPNEAASKWFDTNGTRIAEIHKEVVG